MNNITENTDNNNDNKETSNTEEPPVTIKTAAEKLEKREGKLKKKNLKIFNKNLHKFIDELNLSFPELSIDIKEHFPNIKDNSFTGYIEKYYQEIQPHLELIKQLSQNSLEFNLESELVLFDCININKYLELDNSENSKKTILNYLQVLYASAYNYSNSIYNIAEMIKKIYNNVQNKDETQQEDVNEEIKNYLQVLENIREMSEKNNNDTDADSLPIPEISDDLFGGIIGDLAKDITKDLNTDDFNLNDPTEFISSIFGGGNKEGGSGNNIMNLVQKISGKIHKKIETGEIDQGKLVNEAQNMMGKLGGIFGGGDNSESGGMPDLGKMMSGLTGGDSEGGMPDLGGLLSGLTGGSEGDSNNMDIGGLMNNMLSGKGMMGGMMKNMMGMMGNMFGGKNARIDTNRLNNMVNQNNQRDRLRKKLEDRRKKLAEKQNVTNTLPNFNDGVHDIVINKEETKDSNKKQKKYRKKKKNKKNKKKKKKR